MRRMFVSTALVSLVIAVACSGGSSADDFAKPDELAAQTLQAPLIVPIDSEAIRVQDQRVAVQQFIAKHDSLGKLPAWYTTSGGGRHICDVEGHFKAAESIGDLRSGIADTDLGGAFEEKHKEATLDFVRAVFRDGFVSCPNSDRFAEPWFMYLDQARDAMLTDSLTPENVGLTVVQMNTFLLTAARQAVKNYKLAEYIKNDGGGEAWPEPHLVDIFARKYQFTAEQLGLNKADLDRYLRSR
ncbi:MAG: hypothetical protein AAB617_00420 [Patescibacteria group bacterium]